MKIRVVKNPELVAKIREALKKTGGHCPCKAEFTEDTRCPCKDFRENGIPGETCYCGLYEMLEDDE